MKILNEDEHRSTVELDFDELLAIVGSLNVALTFHRNELHPLIGLHADDLEPFRAEVRALHDRIWERRKKAGLPG